MSGQFARWRMWLCVKSLMVAALALPAVVVAQDQAGSNIGMTIDRPVAPQTPSSPSTPQKSTAPNVSRASESGFPRPQEMDNRADQRLIRLAQTLSAASSAEASDQRRINTGSQNTSSQPLSPSPLSRSETGDDQKQAMEAKPLVPEGYDPADKSANQSGARGASGSEPWLLNTILALTLVVGLIFLVRWVLNRLTGRITGVTNTSAVQVLGRTTVGPRNHVLLLRLAGRILVVGDSAAGLRTLAELNDPEEVAEVLSAVNAAKSDSISRGFTQLLGAFNRQYRQDRELADADGDTGEYRVDSARNEVSGLLSRIRSMAAGGGRL